MAGKPPITFVIDCHVCNAKVAATELGHAENSGFDDENQTPWANKVIVGKCPKCISILVGQTTQLDFGGFDAEDDRWSDIIRVFPKPSKVFSSWRIPNVVSVSLDEADRALQAGASIAACVMLGNCSPGYDLPELAL
jgi:hypothetical protein